MEALLKSSKVAQLKEGLQFDMTELEEIPQKEKDNVLNILKWQGQGFDTRVHIVEPRTGMLLKYQPYRRVANEQGVFYFRKDEHGIDRRYDEGGKLLDAQGQPVIIPEEPRKAKNESKKVS